MLFKWNIRGFENYIVSKEGYILRLEYITNHLHYKYSRFICHNKRNQFRLYKNGKEYIFSKRQLRNCLEKIDSVEIVTYQNIRLPF